MILFSVGLPARPKSPLDSKKDGESLSYSVLPLSDGPEGSSSRPQVGTLMCWIGQFELQRKCLALFFFYILLFTF